MEEIAPPIKLEPLKRPVKRHFRSPQPKQTRRKPKAQMPTLREQRERSGVTLEQIADNTNIPLRHLEELERGDVSNWPPGIYAKSWAREYASEAGINPERVIAIVAPVAEVEPSIDEIKEAREERDRGAVAESPLAPLVQLMRKVAAVVVVVALIVIAALFFLNRDDPPANQSVPAPVGTSGVTPGQPPR
ncbi:MAG: helix-turn-helix transcriptional regulator [Vicinamibacterales bacterium]